MAIHEVRSPQGVTDNNNVDDDNGEVGPGGEGGREQYRAYLSSVYQHRSLTVVTQTTVEDDSIMTASPGDGTIASGTTLATQTSSSIFSNADQTSNQTSSSQETDPPQLLPAQQSDTNDDGGLSDAQLAAAIAVPIIFTALFALLAFLIFRRRRKAAQNQARPATSTSDSNSRSARFLGLREKWGSLHSSSSSRDEKMPEVTSAHNNAYMTGLDTSSRSVSPPSYLAADASAVTALDATRPSFQLSAPAAQVSPLEPEEQDLPPPNPTFLRVARAGSTRSINSDAYSDTASIHSARAARMSVGTVIIPGMYSAHGASQSQSGSMGDPFQTPTPSLMLGRGRSRQGSGESGQSKESDTR